MGLAAIGPSGMKKTAGVRVLHMRAGKMGRPEKGAQCSHHGGAVDDQEAQTWLERGEGGQA